MASRANRSKDPVFSQPHSLLNLYHGPSKIETIGVQLGRANIMSPTRPVSAILHVSVDSIYGKYTVLPLHSFLSIVVQAFNIVFCSPALAYESRTHRCTIFTIAIHLPLYIYTTVSRSTDTGHAILFIMLLDTDLLSVYTTATFSSASRTYATRQVVRQ